jgi:hypothetical protein
MTLKGLSIAVIAAALAFFAGWLVGASGKAKVEQARTINELRAERAETRSAILDGRISAMQTNFGDAVASFQRARVGVGRLQIELREASESEAAGRLEIVATHLDDAERLSALLDRKAEQAAGEAVKALDAVIQ